MAITNKGPVIPPTPAYPSHLTAPSMGSGGLRAVTAPGGKVSWDAKGNTMLNGSILKPYAGVDLGQRLPDPSDQGKYVGNPNHGGGTPPSQGTGGKGTGNVVNAQPTNSVEPVWADDFNWNTATLADAHRKLSTDKYGMVNYAKYSDADAQRLLDSERSSMASTQQPAPKATGGMGAINPSVFPAIANGMFGNANTGGTGYTYSKPGQREPDQWNTGGSLSNNLGAAPQPTPEPIPQPIQPQPVPQATSSFGWQNAQPSQGTGGKGVGNVVNAQPIQSAASLLQPYYNAQQAPTLMSATSNNRAGQPYVYGDLGLTSSDYSLWGSRGNPYTVAGPTYTPGSGRPINPQPIAPIAPPSNGGGGDSDYPTAPGTGGDIEVGDQPWANRKVLGDLYPGLGLAYGLVDGRIDNPYGEGYARLPWYEGSAGGGYGYTEEGYDQFAPGDSDRGIYNAATGERAEWDDAFDDYNTNDKWAQTGFFEGMGNIFGGRTWDGAEGPTVFGQEAPVASTPTLFGNPNSALAKESTKLQIEEKAQKAANRQAIVAAEQAKLDAEQAQWDAQYAQINDLNTQQVGLMNDIKSDMQKQYGTFQDEILSQVAAENASMFDSFAEYKQWMGEAFTTQQSGLDEALAIAAAKSEGLNGAQIDLMNSIAEDMRNDYGDFSGGVDGQLEQMAAENASMFDSLEEYQEWVSDNNATAPATPSNPPPSTVADAVKTGKPFGKEGDDSWSPNGKDVYHGPGHNWNIPDSENKAPPGTVTPPSSGGGDSSSSDEAGSASDSNMADAGFSQEDQDFIDSGFDEEDSGGGDSGGGGGGGSYIATAATNALGKEGLDMFEGWRDYMHTAHPTFTTSYGRYRVTAPKIVSAIDKKDNSTELYQDIWNEYLKPIFNLIKKDMDNPKALSDYKVMVRELTNKYLKGDK